MCGRRSGGVVSGGGCPRLARLDAGGLRFRSGNQSVRDTSLSPGLLTFAILVLSIAMLAVRRVGHRIYASGCGEGFPELAMRGAGYTNSHCSKCFR